MMIETVQFQVKGEVITEGVVTALSERQGVASVLDDKGVEMSCPMARLMPPRKEVIPVSVLILLIESGLNTKLRSPIN